MIIIWIFLVKHNENVGRFMRDELNLVAVSFLQSYVHGNNIKGDFAEIRIYL